MPPAAQQGLAADTSQLGVLGFGSLLASKLCGFGEAGQRWLAQLKPDPLCGMTVADAIDDFLNTYSADVAKVSKASRSLVLRLCPEVQEDLKLGWNTVSYKRSKAFCSINPHSNWVNLQFFEGASLPDPAGLLEGTGKSMRHVKLRKVSDVERKELKDLLLAAEERAE